MAEQTKNVEERLVDEPAGKERWTAPALIVYAASRTEGKDNFNATEGTDTSGPS